MPRRTTRRSIWALVSVVALAASMLFVAAAPASAAATTTLSLQSAGFKVVGSPYTWSFSASRSSNGSPWNVGISARRSAHNGKATQSHTWNFSVPAGDIKISPNLANVVVNTHAHLADTVDYGTIDLHATQRSKLHTASTKCKKTKQVLFTSSTRTGKLGGTFDFKPGTGFPADVEKAPIGFTVSRFVNFNRNCPSGGGGGGGGGGGCSASKSFGGFIPMPFFNVTAAPIGRSSFLSFSQTVSGASIAPVISISHSITVSGPASAIVIAKNGNATLSGGAGTPFLSATKLRYEGGHRSKFTFGNCTNFLYEDSYLSGSLNVKFDSGAVLLNGASGLQATTTRVVKT